MHFILLRSLGILKVLCQLYGVQCLSCVQAWTKAATIPNALVSMLVRLPKIKFAIVTLGEDGCIMLERSVDGKYATVHGFIEEENV